MPQQAWLFQLISSSVLKWTILLKFSNYSEYYYRLANCVALPRNSRVLKWILGKHDGKA